MNSVMVLVNINMLLYLPQIKYY